MMPLRDRFSAFVALASLGTPRVTAWAEANLQRFADEWRRHYHGYLPVKNDTEVTDEDVQRCNLILFGDPGNNLWISRMLP